MATESPEGARGHVGRGELGRFVNVCGDDLSVSSRSVRAMPERRCFHTPGGACSIGRHVVSCPKYRRSILGGRTTRRLDGLLGQIAAEYGWQIVAHDVMPGQVHLFVRVGPVDAPASAVRAVKGRTTRILRPQIEHPWDAVLAS